MVTMISIDPGEHCCYARWAPGLVACGPWAAVCDVDDEVAVIEDQIIPRRCKNPASIITLAQRAGAVAAVFGWPEWDTVTWVTPKAWKQSTKKPKTAALWATYAIHQRNARALSQSEFLIYNRALMALPDYKKHDLVDAVGIGLWHLGRT